ncbi:MAG TPA: ThiF family adenylyltransferase [Tepidisphaeraceae bacterium]|nr:ThiF family adenylyltransferase [Tepidisphaeraceae bacterium]
MADPISITPADLAPATADPAADDRFHRFKLIAWWDQHRLANANVLVIGAGALGNELIKNLALLGVGNVLVADLDSIENSNLSRSVLYRATDNGQPKAAVAARAAREIYPGMKTQPFVGNVVYDLGLGVFRWADVILGGLDNREARLAINRACWRLNKPWVDGAIEQIQGTARVFAPDGPAQQAPCYECTMSETDWRLLNLRRSCNLLTREQMQTGHTPTTPTISSIIAGVQVQEAVKLLHGLESFPGKGWVFAGLSADSYMTEFQRKDDCYSHDPLDEVVELPHSASTLTARDLLRIARDRLGPEAQIELGRDVLEKLTCPRCGQSETLFSSLGKVSADKVWCPTCAADRHQARREVVTFHKIRGDEPFLDRPLAAIGVPPFDILVSRNFDRAIGFELTGDAPAVLGDLHPGAESDNGLEFE